MKSNILGRLIKAALILIVLLVISFALFGDSTLAVFDLVPPQVEGLLTKGMHYLAQGADMFSPYQSGNVFFRDWLIGGVIIGWVFPALLFFIGCFAGYYSTIHHSRGKQNKSAINFSLLQTRISKTYWRAKFLELEKLSFTILAVGGSVFLILLMTRKYLVGRFPFIDGATLFCFIAFGYIYTAYFLFYRGESPRKVLFLIDKKLKLKEGLITLWDSRHGNETSGLYIVLAERVRERVKKFKPALIFPHHFPRFNIYNFIIPLLIVCCASFSTALALPGIKQTLKKYINPNIVIGGETIPTTQAAALLDNDLSKEGEELKKLSQQLASDPDVRLAQVAPALQKLGDELVKLSKTKSGMGIVTGGRSRIQTGYKGQMNANTPNIAMLKSMMQRNRDAGQRRPGSKGGPPPEILKRMLRGKEGLPPVRERPKLPIDSFDAPQKTKGQVSAQLRKLAMEILQFNLSAKAAREQTLGTSEAGSGKRGSKELKKSGSGVKGLGGAKGAGGAGMPLGFKGKKNIAKLESLVKKIKTAAARDTAKKGKINPGQVSPVNLEGKKVSATTGGGAPSANKRQQSSGGGSRSGSGQTPGESKGQIASGSGSRPGDVSKKDSPGSEGEQTPDETGRENGAGSGDGKQLEQYVGEKEIGAETGNYSLANNVAQPGDTAMITNLASNTEGVGAAGEAFGNDSKSGLDNTRELSVDGANKAAGAENEYALSSELPDKFGGNEPSSRREITLQSNNYQQSTKKASSQTSAPFNTENSAISDPFKSDNKEYTKKTRDENKSISPTSDKKLVDSDNTKNSKTTGKTAKDLLASKWTESKNTETSQTSKETTKDLLAAKGTDYKSIETSQTSEETTKELLAAKKTDSDTSAKKTGKTTKDLLAAKGTDYNGIETSQTSEETTKELLAAKQDNLKKPLSDLEGQLPGGEGDYRDETDFAQMNGGAEGELLDQRRPTPSTPKVPDGITSAEMAAISEEIRDLGEDLVKLGETAEKKKSLPDDILKPEPDEENLVRRKDQKRLLMENPRQSSQMNAGKLNDKKPGMSNKTKHQRMLAQQVGANRIEIMPAKQMEALPDEFFDWYIKSWKEADERPVPPPSAPLKDEVKERIKVTARKMELLSGQMMIISNPKDVKFSPDHMKKMSNFMRRGSTTNASPGGKPPGFSSIPNPNPEFQEQVNAAADELQEIVTEAQEWMRPKPDSPPEETSQLGDPVTAGGTGKGGREAVVVNGQQNLPEEMQDIASVRLQSFPKHDSVHDSMVNVSMETGDQTDTSQESSKEQLSVQRQQGTTGTSMSDVNAPKSGGAGLGSFISRQRKGFQSIKTAMDKAKTPDDFSKITRQLASLAKGMEDVSLELSKAIKSEGQNSNKTIPAGQLVKEAGVGDNPDQSVSKIPSEEHKLPEGEHKSQNSSSRLPNKIDALKQLKKDDKVTKDSGDMTVKTTPSKLITGKNSLTSIASQFAKLRTSVMGATQPEQLRKITQEMLDLSKQLEAEGMEDMFLIGAEGKSGKKITGKYIARTEGKVKVSSGKSSSDFLYPEVGALKTGKNLAKRDKRSAVLLPKEIKEKFIKLQRLSKKLKKSKNPDELKSAAREIIKFTHQLRQLTPKRDEQAVAIVKEGVKREGKRIAKVSRKISKEKNPQKINAYAMELSRYAANLKTIGDKAAGLGWKEGKGLKKYASNLERKSKVLSKKNNRKSSRYASGANDQYYEMALRRDAHRIEELSRIVATSKDPVKVQKAAREMLALSKELSDIHYNMGLGKARTSFAPDAEKTAQDAVKEGGQKLRQLLSRIKNHQGALKVGNVGLQLNSIAGSLRRAGNKGVGKQQADSLKDVAGELQKMAKEISNKGTASAIRDGYSAKRSKGKKVGLKSTPLEKLLPKLAKYSDKLNKMNLQKKRRRYKKKRGAGKDKFAWSKNRKSGKALKQLELGLQENLDAERLLQVASQLEDLGRKLLDSSGGPDKMDPSQRPWWKEGQTQDSMSGDKKTYMQEENNLVEMKKQAAVKQLDNFLNDLTEQKQRMGSYSIKDVTKNIGEDKVVSAMSKGVGGGNRQSLFSKGEKTASGQGMSGLPLSEDIDNAYPMEENLSSNDAFDKIIRRVKKYRDKLSSPKISGPTGPLKRVATKRQKTRNTNTSQPKIATELRRRTGVPQGEASMRKSAILPKNKKADKNVPVVYNKDYQPQADIIKVPISASDLPEGLQDLNVPLESQNPATEIDKRQKLAAQQDVAAPINRSQIPQEYQNIIQKIYLYIQDYPSTGRL